VPDAAVNHPAALVSPPACGSNCGEYLAEGRDQVSRIPVILLVEDDPGDVLLITEALERSQVPPRLHVAADGQEALEFLHRTGLPTDVPRPDLILLDLNMPRMDGRQVLAAVKADPRLRAIPVVVLTTSDAEADVLHSYHAHASAFVTKPLDLDDLETVVDQIGRFFTSISTLLPPERRIA
jgi:CheY-like chemotaxis protein